MVVNLKNDKALNDYISRLVYHGGKPDVFTKAELKNKNFVRKEKDKIIQALTYQWMKKSVRDYLAGNENSPCLEKVVKAEAGDASWVKCSLVVGKPVYLFDETKVPVSFNADLQKVTDYLYTVGDNYIEKTLARPNFNVTLGALKDRPEHRSFTLALAMANKWHERIAARAAERKMAEVEREALLQGTEFIMDLGDGFTVVQLMTPEALDKESDYMGHCVGQGSYDRGVKDNYLQIYSLRDKNGDPHATFEVRDGEVLQCKGKANKAVVSKYIPYVQKFVIDYKLNPENDLKSICLCRDINGKLHNIYSIPDGTEFENLDLSYMSFERLPDLTRIRVNGVLNLTGCEFLQSLKGLPEELKGLNCESCYSLTELKYLPENLQNLNCTHCDIISLEGLPDSLVGLNCLDCKMLVSLKGLPERLKQLNCSFCSSLTSLNGVPKNLKMLFCHDCDLITTLEGLPDGLEKINCTCCESLKSLEGCSPTIETIYIEWCPNLKYIPDDIPNDKIRDTFDDQYDEQEIKEYKDNWRALQKEREKETASVIANINKVAQRGER